MGTGLVGGSDVETRGFEIPFFSEIGPSTWDSVKPMKNFVNSEINYRPQLVIAEFLPSTVHVPF